MKKNYIGKWILGLFIALVAFGFTGCTKDQDDESFLMGEWIEESPIEGRTELYFHSVNRVSRISDGYTDEYYYRVIDNSIFLRPLDGPEEVGESELFFKQITNNSFQIENLYASIPEMETTYMIFRRKAASDEIVEEETEGARGN